MQILENNVRTSVRCRHPRSSVPLLQLIAAAEDSVVEPYNLCRAEAIYEVDNVPGFKIPSSLGHTVQICCVVGASLVFCSTQGTTQRFSRFDQVISIGTFIVWDIQ